MLHERRQKVNDHGETTYTWAPGKATWTEITPLSGREAQELEVTVANATHKVRLRYLEGLNEKDRLRFGERIFNIEHVGNVDERSIWMLLIVIEEK